MSRASRAAHRTSIKIDAFASWSSKLRSLKVKTSGFGSAMAVPSFSMAACRLRSVRLGKSSIRENYVFNGFNTHSFGLPYVHRQPRLNKQPKTIQGNDSTAPSPTSSRHRHACCGEDKAELRKRYA